MRLRARLTLAFAALAVCPAVLVAWATLSSVRSSFDEVLEARLDGVEALLRAEIDRTVSDLSHAVSALASGTPSVDRLAREVRLGTADVSSTLPLGEILLAGRHDLQALVLLDGEGRVLSSGHLPARSGDTKPDLARLARESPGEPALQWIEVQRDTGIERSPALVVSMPVDHGDPDRAMLHVIGGRMIDEVFAERLRSLSGARVRLILEEDDLDYQGGSRLKERTRRLLIIEDGEESQAPRASDGRPAPIQVELAVSEDALARARGRILLVLGGSGILGVLAAVLLGALLASRITRPIDALAVGATRISRGEYEPVVAPSSSREMAALMDAFNSMTMEIRASRDRIAAAERIAAWQGIARRLAHEIKNPLTPIAMSIETLRRTFERRHPQLEEIFAESTQAILEEVGALERLVTEFSRFARLPAPALERVDPGELVEGALALFPEPPEGIRIEKETAPDLPEIMADREQLGQVLLNLVANSLQALEAGPRDSNGRVTVRTRACNAKPGESAGARGASEKRRGAKLPEHRTGPPIQRTAPLIEIEVEDNGPGIPHEHKSELFTPYFTTKETGTGLGLAICHRIVTEHGGHIEVDSKPGEGARFSVVLPAAD